MNKVALKGVGSQTGTVNRKVDAPPHETVRLRVEIHLLFDQEVEVDDFFHPDDYKGSESWDDFISGSIAEAAGDEYDGADVLSVRRWMDDWNMLQNTDEDITIEWEWVK